MRWATLVNFKEGEAKIRLQDNGFASWNFGIKLSLRIASVKFMKGFLPGQEVCVVTQNACQLFNCESSLKHVCLAYIQAPKSDRSNAIVQPSSKVWTDLNIPSNEIVLIPLRMTKENAKVINRIFC